MGVDDLRVAGAKKLLKYLSVFRLLNFINTLFIII